MYICVRARACMFVCGVCGLTLAVYFFFRFCFRPFYSSARNEVVDVYNVRVCTSLVESSSVFFFLQLG